MFKGILFLLRIALLTLGYLNTDILFPNIQLDNLLHVAGLATGLVMVDLWIRPLLKLLLLPLQLLTLGMAARVGYGLLLLVILGTTGIFVEALQLGHIQPMSVAQSAQALLATWVFTLTLLMATRPR
jgi:uncharacterized membrane protein YvlD (DUF360 family)